VSWRHNGRWPQTSATPRKAAARKLRRQSAFANERASPWLGRGDDQYDCGTADDNASADDSCVDAMYQRLRQIEVERVKALNDVHNLSISQDPDMLRTAIRRLTALERYSQRSHSKLKKHIF